MASFAVIPSNLQNSCPLSHHFLLLCSHHPYAPLLCRPPPSAGISTLFVLYRIQFLISVLSCYATAAACARSHARSVELEQVS